MVSPAQAYGLMQVTPDAGRYVCKRHGATFDLGRLKNDPVYNAALGAAELGGLIEDYRGSYILTFAAYNAGRGSVKKWIERYGDPRDPKVDAVDWVEQIPFSETRNYVQRIMENLQVYRARFGGGTKLQIEADLHRGASVNNPPYPTTCPGVRAVGSPVRPGRLVASTSLLDAGAGALREPRSNTAMTEAFRASIRSDKNPAVSCRGFRHRGSKGITSCAEHCLQSKAKIFFQSFFMLTTVHLFKAAASRVAWLSLPKCESLS